MKKISRVLALSSPVAFLALLPFASAPARSSPPLCHDILVRPNGSGTVRIDLTMGGNVQVPSMFGSRVAVTASKATRVTVSPAEQGEIEVLAAPGLEAASRTTLRGSAGASLEPGMSLVFSPAYARSVSLSTSAAASIVLGPDVREERTALAAPAAPSRIAPY